MKKLFIVAFIGVIIFISGCYRPQIDTFTIEDLVSNFVSSIREESSENLSSLHTFPLELKRISGETATFHTWDHFNLTVAAMFVVYEFHLANLVDYSYTINGSIAEVNIEIYLEAYSKLDSREIKKELKMFWKARLTDDGWKIFYEEETYNHNLP